MPCPQQSAERFPSQLLQSFGSDRFLSQPRYDHHSMSAVFLDLVDLFEFGLRALNENGVGRTSYGKASVDHPGKRFDARAAQIDLQLGGL